MIVGGTVAAVDGSLSWTWLAVTGVALFGMEVAKNAWGDVFDFDSGTDLAVAPEDRTEFSGGKRVLVGPAADGAPRGNAKTRRLRPARRAA